MNRNDAETLQAIDLYETQGIEVHGALFTKFDLLSRETGVCQHHGRARQPGGQLTRMTVDELQDQAIGVTEPDASRMRQHIIDNTACSMGAVL